MSCAAASIHTPLVNLFKHQCQICLSYSLAERRANSPKNKLAAVNSFTALDGDTTSLQLTVKAAEYKDRKVEVCKKVEVYPALSRASLQSRSPVCPQSCSPCRPVSKHTFHTEDGAQALNVNVSKCVCVCPAVRGRGGGGRKRGREGGKNPSKASSGGDDCSERKSCQLTVCCQRSDAATINVSASLSPPP